MKELAWQLAELGRYFYKRGWALGTSGNFSAVVQLDPIHLIISQSSIDKGELSSEHMLLIDESLKVIGEKVAKPSDESLLHIEIVRSCGAKVVLHTHSIWATLLSEAYEEDQGLSIYGYEMLKGLEGVKSHEHIEWIPIIRNCQEMSQLADQMRLIFKQKPNIHAILLAGHGLYTWGKDIKAAKRHVEILEFLLEVIGRKKYGV